MSKAQGHVGEAVKRIWFWQKTGYLEAGWTLAQWEFGEPLWACALFDWPSVLFDAIWPAAHPPAHY